MTREEAIKQIEEFMVIDDWSLVYLPDLHDALELAIEALTENESLQRPHGEWIFHDTYTVCGNCGKHFPYKNHKKNFCDECGADMREGDRNEC